MSTSEENDAGARSSLLIPTDPFQEEQTVLILVGLVGSGKSTFAEALERYVPRFCRCNQDDLGDRQKVERLVYHTLHDGRSPCIDRTNFNARQRSYWTAIARAFPMTSISIIVFDTPYHVCASRLERRTSHPTIENAQQGIAVLRKFASDFQLPSPDEEYDHILYLRPADHPSPEYTQEDVSSILARLKASTRDAGEIAAYRSVEPCFGYANDYSRTRRARGYRGGAVQQGSSSLRGTLRGSSWFAGRVGGSNGSNDSNWRRTSSGVDTKREELDQQRSTAVANVPTMEGSKDSAEQHHNST